MSSQRRDPKLAPLRPEAAPAPRPASASDEAASPGTIASGYGRRDYVLRRVLATGDALAIAAAGALAFALSSTRVNFSDYIWILPTLPVWILIFRAYGLYERDIRRISNEPLDDIPGLLHGMVIGTLLSWTYFRFVAPVDRLLLAEVFTFAASAVVLLLFFRAVGRRAVRGVIGPERVVFLGETATLPAVVRKIDAHPEYGVEPIGIIRQQDDDGDSLSVLPVLATLEGLSLQELVHRHAVDRIIVAHDSVDDATLLELLQECGWLSVKVSILPRHVDALGPSVEIDQIEGVTVLDLNPLVLPRSSRMFKRMMDVAGAAAGLILMSPVMAVIAIAIKIDSRGPILFKQERIGRRGRPFAVLKFRTMVPDAESLTEELLAQSEDPDWLKLERDPRITRFGGVLRLASLDELPQLINVFKGEMSLVGPRPLLEYQDARVTGWSRTRLDLAPGITGLWQVLGRTNIPFEEMVKLDTLYVTNWSLWVDVKLILQTFSIVLTRKGAN